MEKTILHCDLNNFFASVECLKHPELKNYPVAVCGNIENRHGIILAKNENAKKYGVKTAEVVWQAKQKCPGLVLLSPHMNEYERFSSKAHEVYARYTDLIEPFGIDECWLDVTGSELLFGDGETIANKIREEIKKELGLTISVGVSFNKIFAKLGSDMKKPDAVTVISKQNFKEKVWCLQVTDLLGIGKATAKELQKYGINTIGDLAQCEEKFLLNKLGKNGIDIYKNANGMGNDIVSHQDNIEVAKSIGNSTTCPKNLENNDEVFKVLFALSESVCSRLRHESFLACGFQITVKDCDFTTREYQAPLDFPTRHPKELAKSAFAIFKKNYSWEKSVRLLGVRVFNLICDKQTLQVTLFRDQRKENELENLEVKIDDVRKRYGKAAVFRATLLGESISGHSSGSTGTPKDEKPKDNKKR